VDHKAVLGLLLGTGDRPGQLVGHMARLGQNLLEVERAAQKRDRGVNLGRARFVALAAVARRACLLLDGVRV
jgi:hypothetical protein